MPEPERARPADLGELRRTYRGSTREPWVIAGSTAAIGLTAGALHGGAIVAAAAAGLGLGLGAAYALATRSRLEVRRHERGIEIVGRRAARIAFADVDAVHAWIPRVASRFGPVWAGARVIVVTHAGERHELDGAQIADLRDLARDLLRECSQPLLAPAIEALARGEALTFGPLRFDRETATTTDGWRPWSEVTRVRWALDRIELLDRDGRAWSTLAREVLPHPPVLRALLERRTRVEIDDATREAEL